MISVREIVKTFGGICAVNGCSLDVAEGTITGLIGRNGAGRCRQCSGRFDVGQEFVDLFSQGIRLPG